MSSPQMNNVIVLGCGLCYASVVLLGMDVARFKEKAEVVCSARAWVLSIGFTLAFGAMFGKTWRVHCIFTNISMSKKIIKDYQLMLIVVVLLLLDICILTVWMVTDPMWTERRLLRVEKLGTDSELHVYTRICAGGKLSAWIAALFVYKGLLLVIGCFFAWETRHVSIPALNDSKYIGLSVYNVLVMCLAGAAVSFALTDSPTAAFVIVSLLIVFCTTVTLGLVFLPKLVELRRDPHGEEKRVRATLRKTSRRPTQCEQEAGAGARLGRAAEENQTLKLTLQQKQAELRLLQLRLRECGSSTWLSGDCEVEETGDDTACRSLDSSSSECVWVPRTSSRGAKHSNLSEEDAFSQDIADVQARLLAEYPRLSSASPTSPSSPGVARGLSRARRLR